MKKINTFPTFHFYPIKLQTEVQRIRKRYKHGDQVSQNLTLIKLPDLLTQIRRLSNNTKVIIKFAQSLKPLDINILSTEFPYEQENEETVNKIITILMERYNRIVGRRFWQHFQLMPSNIEITKLLEYIFLNEEANYLALQSLIREQYNKIFSSSHAKVKQISFAIGKERRSLKESFLDWKIDKDSKLALKLWKNILLSFMKEDWFVDLQGEDVIEAKLKNMSLDDYKKIIYPYLESFSFGDYHHKLFVQLIDRLHDPRENRSRWKGFSTKVIKKVESRLVQEEMFAFFGTDSIRFYYWKKYISYAEHVDFVDDPPIAAMYFGDFVVVEFGEINNAAYFYEQEGFSRHLAHKLKINIHESELKNRHTAYFIRRLNHTRNWPTRYDEYMNNFLRGNLSYQN